VAIKEENNILLITISSFGNIIPEHEKSKLFSRGFRSTVHNSKVDGTGMGLHNAYKILKHFHSEVSYSTQIENSLIGWNNFTIKCSKIF
jgi:signal transduction histidine kinase